MLWAKYQQLKSMLKVIFCHQLKISVIKNYYAAGNSSASLLRQQVIYGNLQSPGNCSGGRDRRVRPGILDQVDRPFMDICNICQFLHAQSPHFAIITDIFCECLHQLIVFWVALCHQIKI